jgi:hypothetical protein
LTWIKELRAAKRSNGASTKERLPVNHKHRQTLHAIFAHPVGSNIDPKHVHALIEALGGSIAHGGHGHVIAKLDGHTHGFHDTHHALSKDEVTEFRKFLDRAGIDPLRDFPLESSAA